MTFDLNTANSNLFSHLIYNIQMKLYQAHLLWINIPIVLIVILISGHLLIQVITADEQDITFKAQLLTVATTIFTGIAILAFVDKATDNPYIDPADQITSGSLVINKKFGFNSNDNDVDCDNNKLILLGYDDDIELISLNRTFNKITLTPISRTGKAYLRILTYARKYKRDIYNPTINVQLDKTTLKYTDINGNHTAVCYANNQNQSANTNHETVLHY